jgi:Arc/MetJ-type ribon-helix-helix transcriptional regulator
MPILSVNISEQLNKEIRSIDWEKTRYKHRSEFLKSYIRKGLDILKEENINGV